MLSKEEIEKALNNLWCSVTDVMFNVLYSQEEMQADLKIILNEFKRLYNRNKQLEQENNKQNKIIDEMAKEMYSNISMLEMAKIGQAIDYDPRKMFAGISDKEAIDCIKQYFEKKVEG